MLTPPLPMRLDDPQLERVRQSHDRSIRELQDLPASSTQILNDVVLPDAVIAIIPHRLGRPPRIVLVSPPRGPIAIGIIEERVAENPDRAKFVALKASGMGTTVTVDVEVK